MSDLILYGADYSVYSRIARMVCLELGLAHDFVQTDIFTPETLPPDFTILSPFGKIPVLKQGSFTLFETGAIIRHLNRISASHHLIPTDDQALARMDQVIGLMDSYGYRAMVWDLFVEGRKEESDPDILKRGEETALQCLDCLEKIMGEAPYLAGTKEASLADFHAYAMVCYLALNKNGADMIGHRLALQKWFARMADRASIQQTVSPLERADPQSDGN